MKRRGFLAAMLGAPVAAVAATKAPEISFKSRVVAQEIADEQLGFSVYDDAGAYTLMCSTTLIANFNESFVRIHHAK